VTVGLGILSGSLLTYFTNPSFIFLPIMSLSQIHQPN